MNIYADSFRDNWDLPALTDYTSGTTMTYCDLARTIARTHLFYELSGIKPGDKVALMGKNSIEWVMIYMSTISYGAVIVPVLQEFSAPDAQHIINHSDAKMLFVDEAIWRHSMELEKMPNVAVAISLSLPHRILAESPTNKGLVRKVTEVLPKKFERRYPEGYTARDVRYRDCPKDAVAEINYTSGTTGFSKGVMLTFNNLCGNVVFGIRSKLLTHGQRCLSFLPLAHAYG